MRFLICIVYLLLSAQSAVANQYEGGLAAYQRGDFESAFKEFKILADRGDAWAQGRIGTMYETGQGVPKDEKKAVQWYFQGALGGQAWAQVNLGTMYREGRGVEQNYTEAARWFRRAAQDGNASGQANYGYLLHKGLGIPRDPVGALLWFKKAAVQGNTYAKSKMEELAKEIEQAGKKPLPSAGKDIPAYLKPFGIELGKSLPAGIEYNREETVYLAKQSEFIHWLYQVETPEPFAEIQQSDPWYDVYTTKISGTVYRVEVSFSMDSSSQCKAVLSAYYEKLRNDAPAQLIQNWIPYQIVNDEVRFDFAAIIKGPAKPVVDVEDPLVLKEMGDFRGVGIIFRCDPKERSSITFIHYPSVELRIAENFHSDPLLKKLSGKSDKPSPQRLPYMNPFGIPLGKLLQQSVRKSEEAWKEFENYNSFEIAPPQPHQLFQYYNALTSKITGTAFFVLGARAYESQQLCLQSLNKTATALASQYRAGPPQWYRNNITSGEFTYAVLKLVNPEMGIREEFPIQIRFECLKKTEVDQKEFEKRHGSASKLEWSGSVRFIDTRWRYLSEMEQCVMNPERGGCGENFRFDFMDSFPIP
ncbi:MAG: sel1 repeat family protein [SAR324 cluster bacterium]|nr:sel1 repeat family protein [SAR324 cluster bacterium]